MKYLLLILIFCSLSTYATDKRSAHEKQPTVGTYLKQVMDTSGLITGVIAASEASGYQVPFTRSLSGISVQSCGRTQRYVYWARLLLHAHSTKITGMQTTLGDAVGTKKLGEVNHPEDLHPSHLVRALVHTTDPVIAGNVIPLAMPKSLNSRFELTPQTLQRMAHEEAKKQVNTVMRNQCIIA